MIHFIAVAAALSTRKVSITSTILAKCWKAMFRSKNCSIKKYTFLSPHSSGAMPAPNVLKLCYSENVKSPPWWTSLSATKRALPFVKASPLRIVALKSCWRLKAESGNVSGVCPQRITRLRAAPSCELDVRQQGEEFPLESGMKRRDNLAPLWCHTQVLWRLQEMERRSPPWWIDSPNPGHYLVKVTLRIAFQILLNLLMPKSARASGLSATGKGLDSRLSRRNFTRQTGESFRFWVRTLNWRNRCPLWPQPSPPAAQENKKGSPP